MERQRRLFITDAAPDVRVTTDIDVIVEIASLGEYYRLADDLRSRGFTEDVRDGAPLCRWHVDDVTVDVMPTEKTILGFSNRWYPQALQDADRRSTCRRYRDPGRDRSLFLATKIEAFWHRGQGDFLASHDLEDIIALIDGRSELVGEVRTASEPIRTFLSEVFREFLGDSLFLEALPGHLLPDGPTGKDSTHHGQNARNFSYGGVTCTSLVSRCQEFRQGSRRSVKLN